MDLRSLYTVAERIRHGELPSCLQNSDWRLFVGRDHLSSSWTDFCCAWQNIAWVRYQGFERDADAEAAAEDFEGETEVDSSCTTRST